MTKEDNSNNTNLKYISTSFLISHPSHLIALGFGSGMSKLMPGTVGSLFGWFSFYILSITWPKLFITEVWFMIVIFSFIFGIWICDFTGKEIGVPDHGAIVWDEIVSIWLIMIFIFPSNFSFQFFAFILFRIFDITKPPPIKKIEKLFKGGFGVMFDDLIAAFYSLVTLAIFKIILLNRIQ
tara:strand:- start:1367 stop:1909 length:543 start_codon:yes stop_codon:yes gene_type:complete